MSGTGGPPPPGAQDGTRRDPGMPARRRGGPAVSGMLVILFATLVAGCVSVRSGPGPSCDAAPATIGTPIDLDFALDLSRGVADVQPEEPSEEIATVRFLARLPRIRALLVDNSLVLSQLDLDRRFSTSSDARGIPDLVVTALRIESLPGSMLATLGPEVMAWLTLDQATITIMEPDKPTPTTAEVAGRTVQQTLWDDHLLAWFAHGEVLYVVLAANAQLLALAVDELPAPRVPAPGCGGDRGTVP